MNGPDGKWVGFGLGDTDPDVRRNHPNWHAVTLIREKLHDKYKWARDMGVTPGSTITEVVAAAIAEFQSRAGLPVLLDVNGRGYADLRTRVRLGSYPPPPPPRHAMLTFRGTGGIVGQDYTSRIAQACADVVEEIPILYPASMGGIPVGAANNTGAPSGNTCVQIAVDMAADWLDANPHRSFLLCGYSLGAYAASRVRAELLPGGRLERHAGRFVAGVMLGNPARPFGHTYYLGAIPAGFGIANWQLPQAACTWDWCELVEPGDMYANTPGGDVGDVIRKVQEMVMNTTVSDPIGTVRKMIPLLLQLLDEAGVEFPFVIPLLVTNALAGLLAAFLPGLPAAMSGGETGAAVQAAIVALKFFASNPPTAAHISYEWREAWPGMSYLSLGIQHVRDWSTNTPVLV
ncbi:hypothetical protein [Mycolicibacterium goodii]|uniref:hypothetical protein n=1 Tax=Mycolicibacterium goodii TaxID=134601 RepID=UPI001BDCFB0B|nr:hypothetical protein [Mycolicibacterium goodii]MBU8830815.1 hypothetical protein [Mycolicibacterium goodii]